MTASPRLNHYRVIYADPPWTFSTYSRKGKGRSAEAYYDCMSLADIKALPVAEWAAADCVLLLWTTDPLLPTALDVIRCMGVYLQNSRFLLGQAEQIRRSGDLSRCQISLPASASGRAPTLRCACWRPAAIRIAAEAERAQADRLAAARA